jgi:hypothetical protein
MHGTLTRVFAAYPLAIPAVFMALAYLFPGHIGFDQSSQRVNVRSRSWNLARRWQRAMP